MTSGTSGGPFESLDEDRRKHLDHIQAAVGRMASASSTAKGWLLPVATGTYGYALTKSKPAVAFLGIAAVLIFASLDAQYLRQERAFRALYRAAVQNRVDRYDMNSRAFYGKSNGDADDLRQENCRWSKVLWSWSLAGFYVPVLLLGACVTFAASWR